MNKVIRSYNWKFDYNMMVNDLHAFRDAHNLHWYEIDVLAGIGQGNAHSVAHGQTNSKINTLLALANAMDIDVRTYFVLDV